MQQDCQSLTCISRLSNCTVSALPPSASASSCDVTRRASSIRLAASGCASPCASLGTARLALALLASVAAAVASARACARWSMSTGAQHSVWLLYMFRSWATILRVLARRGRCSRCTASSMRAQRHLQSAPPSAISNLHAEAHAQRCSVWQ